LIIKACALFLKNNNKMKDCKHPPNHILPVVNLSKCEGKGPCIQVCPYDVFKMKSIFTSQFLSLNAIGKIKTLVHGNNKAFAVNADKCLGCGLCITACPQKAIKLSVLIK
jgi:4Fe-4S ferredoxin